ncbi:MAG: class I SAM-dependent methyltransferase [Bdellovibrionales bacterium]|nr:class I SAM-dependent methyltransferase [Bdellovibrionales bacterium]
MGSTQDEVEVSYGVSNDFFKLWLDERMNYTCALFEDTENFSDNFEQAQDNKLRRLSRFANIGPHTESVLDIGCGWGANIEYQALVNKVPDVHGFTLSPEQAKKCQERNLPNTTATCDDYKTYQPPRKFDAIMSICMMEHIVSPEDARSGKAIELYRDYFRRAHEWSKPGTYFGLQTITRCQVPRNKKDLDDLRHATYVIFPGAVTPRVEDIIVATIPYFEVMEMHSMRFHYRKTCEHWLTRLQKHEALIREKWGSEVFEDYDRYLSTCITAFENNWQSLHQYSLKRLD